MISLSHQNQTHESIVVIDTPECRICQEYIRRIPFSWKDTMCCRCSRSEKPVVSPCGQCSGSGGWIHLSCLEKWLRTRPVYPGFQPFQCEVCKGNYQVAWINQEWRVALMHLMYKVILIWSIYLLVSLVQQNVDLNWMIALALFTIYISITHLSCHSHRPHPSIRYNMTLVLPNSTTI